ncbi:UDP-glucose flavonoid 3-O-glucosyltransferase 7-like [Salvia miltiorrhiza]|uniref:UDP-glucose flavonoid 3-O-glucosyltransferase 7-like n=1 Tax=Salvia miltiorrhiza TaxID=226208 RepID=UPI0025ACC9EE|nr:UDP-glucose flavonoid 3-O-glucosyltransferase 7-like [Salvia miltiorrhiza]
MGGASATTDILVLPFFGQGHLFPCAELCKHLSSHNCNSIFIIPSHLSSSIPSDLPHHPSVEIVQIESSSSSPPPETTLPPDASDGDWSGLGTKPGLHHHQQLAQGIESFLSERYEKVRPAFVVMDVMMNWSKDIFKKANIPIVSFFTSGACSAAMEYAAWKAHVENIRPDQAQKLPGLPESMALSYSDTKRQDRRRHEHGGGRGPRGGRGPTGRDGGRGGGRGPRGSTRWMDETEGSTAVLINTCDGLEAPFLKYLTGQVEKPVFGVGPLLPETFWKSIGSVVHDRDSRPNRETNYTEDEVIQWLDSKPRHSVIYVSFGTEVGPSLEEFDQLAEALAETDKSFIWVIQPGAGQPGPSVSISGGRAMSDSKEGYQPHGLEERVGNRGLIIKGWAPQLSILSHPSTGGFLSHCGWNSTVEAIACGIPFLAWPIRGDQFYNAKLVVKYHNVGYMIPGIDDESEMLKKFDINQGINLLMDDGEVRNRAIALRGIFEGGYPSSSAASFKTLVELISK